VWDASRIRQALGNLVTNAISYGNGGTVRVSVQSEGRNLVLAVENDGAKLSPKDREAIFHPLVRGSSTAKDRERMHLGLGLFIVRQTAEAHGGSVDVDSDDGRTRFSMILPRTGQETPRSKVGAE
jgi:signal transduction histidine kinase